MTCAAFLEQLADRFRAAGDEAMSRQCRDYATIVLTLEEDARAARRERDKATQKIALVTRRIRAKRAAPKISGAATTK